MTPCAKLSLGKFVVAKPRANGSFNVVFKLPPKLRPSGWSAETPLPRTGCRTGNLADADEVERVRADAEILYKEYLASTGRGGDTGPARNAHDLATCVRFWQNSQAWTDNRPRTNKGYAHYISIVLAWGETIGNPSVERITVQDVEQFLGLYNDRPTQKYHLRKSLRMILQEGLRAKWMTDNPVDKVRVRMPKTKVRLWTDEDVKRAVDQARQKGEKGLAALILTEWEIGQRLTDAIVFRHGAEYQKGVFSFRQSKTDEPVTIPVSATLRDALEDCRVKGSPYLFHDRATERPFRDVDRLWHVFDDCRPLGLNKTLRALRHTCVVELARAGCEIPEIVSITGHTLASAHTILQTYLPRDSKVAENAQRKRGLI